MPEAPDLEVIKEVLDRQLKGLEVREARILKPLELRVLTTEGIPEDAPGRSFLDFSRLGKFLLMRLSGERLLVVNPMLTGALRICGPSERVAKRTSFILSLSDGSELRYLDETQMGMAYYIESSQVEKIPRLAEQGPDVLDQYPSLEEFKSGLRRFQGEIKGILTRGRFLAGIGNAYADEALFKAGIFPFKKRKALSEDDLARLHETIPGTLHSAIGVLRERMGVDIHLKVRDFLQIHGKGGSPCPRCGGNITTIGATQRLTNYCRSCQPGMLLRN